MKTTKRTDAILMREVLKYPSITTTRLKNSSESATQRFFADYSSIPCPKPIYQKSCKGTATDRTNEEETAYF